ncbi:Cytochrome P450 89A2 [Dichanthelium oligosanthes]|uniref:Cytochrome P450 89A2 n=1 Tax=Dichanthelium oligosanthes TaxID=888268 RepID=A0A1E5UI79_9POAL|nr:Cytochrome P450 89A2 [Dichanthelium oligosanthes]
MEAPQLLTLGLAFILFLALFRRSIRHGRRAPAKPALIEISDSAVARTALIDHADAFSNRPLTLFPVALVTGQRRRRSDSISSAQYGPLWRALRCNLTSEALHPSRFDQLAPLQRDSIAALVASLSARVAAGNGDVVVVRDSVHAAVFGLVARLCFGDLVEDTRQMLAMRRVMQEFVRAIGEANVFAGSWLAKLVHWRRWRRFLGYRGQQAAFFLPLVSERERRRRSRCCNDGGIRPYVDTLIDLRVPEDDDDDVGTARRVLTDDEMVSLLSEFLGASTESAVSCIEWTLAHLATQPEVQKKLRREITRDGHGEGGAVSEERLRSLPYLHAVVLESLRLHPPVPFLMRDVHSEGVEIGGATVPMGGTRVHFLIRDMARDRKDWTDPDVFRPERFLAGGEAEGVGAVPGPKEIRMMPFGAGRRYCPGAGMGMMHIKCFLAALVREFEWAPAAGGRGVDFTELDGFFKVMKTPLRAHVKRST